MGSSADSLGTIAVDIVGDYSQLQSDLESATSSAATAGENIAEAFNAAAGGTDTASASMANFDEAVSAAVASGSTLAEAMAQVGAEMQVVAPASVEAAAGTESLAAASSMAAEALEVEEGAVGALLGRLREIGPELLAGFGMVEFGKSVIEATGQLQLATVALTAMTGSAAEADRTLGELRDMSDEEALSFPALVEANQRMTAFGFSTETIHPALQAAADAAVALSTNLSETSNAIDRMAISGLAGARQLVSLGLSTHDLAEAMGVADDQVKAVFKVLDDSTRVQVLTTAIENVKNFQGLAEKARDTIPGMVQQIKNAWESAFQTIGLVMAPVIQAFGTWVASIGKAVDLLARLAAAGASAAATLTGFAPAGALIANAAFGGAAPGAAGGGAAVAGASPDQVKAAVAAQIQQNQALDQFKAVVQDIRSPLGYLIEQEKLDQAAVEATGKAIAQHGIELDAMGDHLTQAGVEADYFQQKFAGGFQAALDSVPPVVDSFAELGNAVKDTNTQLDGLLGKIAPPPFDAVYAAIAKINKELAGDDWRRAESTIAQLAHDDLPEAVRQWDKVITKAQEEGATQGQILALQEKKLQAEITYGEQTGSDVTAQIVGLQNAKIQTQVLIDKSASLGQVYVDLTNTFMNAWGQFASGISDAIVNGKNFGDTMIGVLKKIEGEILNTFIGYVMKQLRDSLLQSSGLLSGVTKQIQSLIGAGASTGTSAAGAAAGGGGGAAGGLKNLGTGLTSTISAVTGIVSAVSDVISNFQQSHANTLLGRIEVSTRGMLNVLLQIQGSLTAQGPYAGLAAQMGSTSSVQAVAAGGGIGGGNVIFQGPVTLTGITQDMVNALFASALRQFKAAGG